MYHAGALVGATSCLAHVFPETAHAQHPPPRSRHAACALGRAGVVYPRIRHVTVEPDDRVPLAVASGVTGPLP